MNTIKLAEFFKNRKEQEEQLQKDLEIKGKQLLELVPIEARGYANEALFYMDKWLLSLYDSTINGICVNSKFKELSDYGFTSKKEAKAAMKLLQTAWKDEIEVKIIDGNYITVEFRLIGVESN